MRANDIMTTPVTAARPSTPVAEAASVLATTGFTALPVVDPEGHLIGIVTEADLIRDRVRPDPRTPRPHDGPAPGTTVGEVMTTPVTTAGAATDVAVLVRTLLDGGHRAVPVVDGTRLVGIVTRRDIVRVFVRDDDSIATDVRHRLETYGGPHRWQVEVTTGVVTITDQYDDATDHHVATVLAEAVPGVVRATTHAVDTRHA